MVIMEIVPNATDFVINDSVDEIVMKLKAKYKIRNNQIVFSYIGRMVKEKNIFFIVDVLRVLKNKGINFKMLFIGQGVDFLKLKKYVKECNLEKDIIFTGVVRDTNNKAALLKLSDLFLFPSTYDTDGIVKIEAACMKVPSICIKDSGAGSNIVDNYSGYLCDLDCDLFASKILEVLKDKKKLKIVGQNAFNDLYLTWDVVVEKLSKLYDQEMEKFQIKKLYSQKL